LNRASIEEELRKEILEINRLTISKKRLEDNSHAKLKNKTR